MTQQLFVVNSLLPVNICSYSDTWVVSSPVLPSLSSESIFPSLFQQNQRQSINFNDKYNVYTSSVQRKHKSDKKKDDMIGNSKDTGIERQRQQLTKAIMVSGNGNNDVRHHILASSSYSASSASSTASSSAASSSNGLHGISMNNRSKQIITHAVVNGNHHEDAIDEEEYDDDYDEVTTSEDFLEAQIACESNGNAAASFDSGVSSSTNTTTTSKMSAQQFQQQQMIAREAALRGRSFIRSTSVSEQDSQGMKEEEEEEKCPEKVTRSMSLTEQRINYSRSLRKAGEAVLNGIVSAKRQQQLQQESQ